MTERKPPGTSFPSWIDQQISAAEERGAFDDLPGAGKPLPDWGSESAADAWLRQYLHREGVSSEELLPTPLRLRKEVERLTGSVQDLPSEQAVRDVVADLNRRIAEWRRIPNGPPVYLPLVDPEAMVAHWRAAHPAPSAPSPGHDAPDRPSPRRRWWHRFRS